MNWMERCACGGPEFLGEKDSERHRAWREVHAVCRIRVSDLSNQDRSTPVNPEYDAIKRLALSDEIGLLSDERNTDG